ncbi:MAG: site-specific DNA-methyltransferase [Planctomycetes bacterium]|nr:site-specific DNA-methyltransferase [Planctomycetota bacterium]
MAVNNQKITENYALYNGDCVEVLRNIPDKSVGLSVYSPPFCGLYNYSSNDNDMSNCASYDDFYKHYEFLIDEISRVTRPGRITAVHAMDIPNPGQKSGYHDLPGNIIRIHEERGFYFFGRITIWKEPLRVAIRTRLKHLTHKQLVKDSTHSTVAAGDTLLIFKRHGENIEPVDHVLGFSEYAGAKEIPENLLKYKGTEIQQENKLSHWIWRRYASCIWDDIRIDRILPYRESREPDDEKHVHPLQLDVIDRTVDLWSNPGDVVLTPFMGVGSEVYGAYSKGRKAIGIELKKSYFDQAAKNLANANFEGEGNLFSSLG